jgi:site-specific DNA-methyltransferase (adenine-specific)
MDLHLGDCIHIMKQIPENSINLVICDPPYGCTRNPWDCQIDLTLLFMEIERVTKENAAVVFFSQGMFTADLMHGPWKKYWRYNLVWAKNKVRGGFNANRQPLRAHEDIVIFYRKSPFYQPQMNIARCMPKGGGNPPKRTSSGSNYGVIKDNISKRYGAEDRFPTSVLLFPVVNEKDCVHATQKPVELLSFLIKSYSTINDLVLDPTMGSGSTGLACYTETRRFIGIEKDPNIFSIAKSRIDSAQVEKEETGR